MHPDIINVLIDTFNDKWIRINTNGLQIYDEQIENFKNHGKVFIALSLDGVSIKSNYPRFGKNEEKLARIIANLNILIKEKIPIMILCTINQYNILEFPKFVQYLETDYKKEIENGILVLSAHYVTNYNKNNGMPTQSEEQIFLEFLQTSKSLIIEKTKNHYDELGHYVKNKKHRCTIPEWMLCMHFLNKSIIQDGNFISFECGMRGMYEFGKFNINNELNMKEYFKLVKQAERYAIVKSNCESFCFVDWVNFDLILSGQIPIQTAQNWFVMFKDQKVSEFIKKYQDDKILFSDIIYSKKLESGKINHSAFFRGEKCYGAYGIHNISAPGTIARPDKTQGLTAYHVNMTTPYLSRNKGKQYEMSKFELLTAQLSAMAWKQYNGEIYLITDKCGEEYIYAQKAESAWNGILPILDPRDSGIIAERFWASGKIQGMSLVKAPCVMLDMDFIVWEPLCLDGFGLVTAHYELLDDLPQAYPPPSFFIMSKRYSFNPAWDFTANPMNTAFVYIKDNDFKDYYTDESTRFMKFERGTSDNGVRCMIFAEQRIMAMCAVEKGIKTDVLMDVNKLSELQNRFTHIWSAKELLRENEELRNEYIKLCERKIKLLESAKNSM
uniref:DUF6734 domain-containing protein n=1 Tax=uncultured bacterium contig00070 TaxID=1181551 RepID=A0A806KG34_9BACT|nr:hypothetical protein [uncultured bacterium contig00070]